MREMKSELVDANEHKIIILQNIPPHQGLVKANRFLLLLASCLMVIVFVLGFFVFPANDILDNIQSKKRNISVAQVIQNPVLSAEINTLKGQLVGLISGSIDSKLRMLEESIRLGNVTGSMGTIQDLKNDVKVLQSYSTPKKVLPIQPNEELLKEVSHLKKLIYLTLTSCGLMIAAIGGIWVKNHFQLVHTGSKYRAELGNRE